MLAISDCVVEPAAPKEELPEHKLQAQGPIAVWGSGVDCLYHLQQVPLGAGSFLCEQGRLSC